MTNNGRINNGRNQISLGNKDIELIDEAVEYKGFSKRPDWIRYAARRDLDEKKQNEISALQTRISDLQKANLDQANEIQNLNAMIENLKGENL